MSEITDQIGLYGAIDQAVVGDRSLVQVVERDLIPYAHGATGWFDRFVEYVRTKEDVPDDVAVFPSVDEALSEMGSGEPPQWWLAVGRLRVIALLVKTVPRFGRRRRPRQRDQLVRALSPLAPNVTAAGEYLQSLDDDVGLIRFGGQLGCVDHAA